MSRYLEADMFALGPEFPEREVFLRTVERLTKVSRLQDACLEEQQVTIDGLRAKNRALVTALLKVGHYARHLDSCASRGKVLGQVVHTRRCDCGLLEVTADCEVSP